MNEMRELMEAMGFEDWCGAICLGVVIGSVVIAWCQAKYGKKESEW
jgi:hypothetical protein